MADRKSSKRRYRIAVLAAGKSPTAVAAAVGYSERHVDAAVSSGRPLPARLAEALQRELGEDAFAFVVGTRALTIQPALDGATSPNEGRRAGTEGASP